MDAYLPSNSQEVKAVLVDRVTYVGIRDIQGGFVNNDNLTPWSWHNLTRAPHTGYPPDACSVSIAAQAGVVSVEVLTDSGEVWETICFVVNEGDPQTPRQFELDCVDDANDRQDDGAGPWVHRTPDPAITDPPLHRSGASGSGTKRSAA
ncbi:hypothetical protein [Streptomyces sp. NPDC012888]|uniref:hypothetical protein n=1 Tax=Streptomyces sp. NPDC012888 TaxID=3364855 RepID=UPI0036C425FE